MSDSERPEHTERKPTLPPDFEITAVAAKPAKPRSGRFADFKGSYEIATRVVDPDLDPGEATDIDLFFTGYGRIESAKLFFAPPPDLIDSTASFSDGSVGATPNRVAGGRFLAFGVNRERFEDGKTLLVFRGLHFESWPDATFFFDDGIEVPTTPLLDCQPIATEQVLQRPPVSFHLATKKSARPGNHILTFYFTYFDGVEWRSSKESVTLRMSSWLERNTWWLTVLGVLLAGVAVVQQLV